jgi:predicted AAA+ superfamily ATPase
MDINAAIAKYKGYGASMQLVERDAKIPKTNLIVAVTGPRRAGKSSLMIMHMNAVPARYENRVFINGEDIDLEGIATKDLDSIETAIFNVYSPSQDQPIYLFIDEVQNLPSWQRWIRTLYDQHRYSIVISGSTSDLTTDKLSSALRGRALNLLILPFSFKEFCRIKGIKTSAYAPREISVLTAALTEFLEFGGYPDVIKAEGNALKSTILNDIYNTMITRDMIEVRKIRKTKVFKQFLSIAAASTCRNISTSNIVEWFLSQKISISHKTVLDYMAFAEEAFLFFLLYPYSRKPKVRNTKPKLYLCDSGLITGGEASKKLENQVLIELIRRGKKVFYYKSAAADVDFVVAKSDKVDQLIQVSYSIKDPNTYARETSSLMTAANELSCSALTILTFNETGEIEKEGKKIKVLPAWKFFLANPRG